jgi:hypothetical protein
MITSLVLIAVLIWAAIAFGIIARRPLLVLLVWLVVGPVISNLIKWPGGNPFFGQAGGMRTNFYMTVDTDVTVKELVSSRPGFCCVLGVLMLERLVRRKTNV